MATVGGIIATLTARTAPFERKMKKAGRTTRKFQGTLVAANKTLRTFGGALIGVASVGALGGMVKRTLEAASALDEISERLNISVEGLQRLKFAAEQNGQSFQTLEMGLQRMARRVGQAAKGTGEAQKAIRELGIDAAKLSKLDLEDQFLAIGAALRDVDSQANKLALTQKIFDSEGVRLLNTLELTNQQWDEYGRQLEKIGILNKFQTSSARAANDAFLKMKTSISAVKDEIVIGYAPVLRKVFDLTEKLVHASRKASEFFQDLLFSLPSALGGNPRAFEQARIARQITQGSAVRGASGADVSLSKSDSQAAPVKLDSTTNKKLNDILDALRVPPPTTIKWDG